MREFLFLGKGMDIPFYIMGIFEIHRDQTKDLAHVVQTNVIRFSESTVT